MQPHSCKHGIYINIAFAKYTSYYPSQGGGHFVIVAQGSGNDQSWLSLQLSQFQSTPNGKKAAPRDG